MNDKMKVWECFGCYRNCVSKGMTEDSPFGCMTEDSPFGCLYGCPNKQVRWHETTRVEITERKPDYKSMAARGQFGKTTNNEWCYLREYSHELFEPFCVQFINITEHYRTKLFTPCAEPIELDPITMNPKEDK